MNSPRKKSIFGGTLLIAGCCIGAGMLGLPLASLQAGFTLSIIPLLVGWGYMYLSGLMILEVYLGEKKNINLMGLLERTLGTASKAIGAGLFLFIFYLILTAYLNGSSILIQDAIKTFFNFEVSQTLSLISNVLLLFFIILFGTRKIEFINRFLVFFMLFFYVCLVSLGASQLEFRNAIYIGKANIVIWSIPIFITSFGFQNLIPTVSHYLGYDAKNIKSVLFKGTILALIIYFVWNFIILGMISIQAQEIHKLNSVFITRLFEYSTPKITFFINGFSFFAIVTSLLAVTLSFVNFISDTSENQKNRALYAAFVLIPPAAFCLFNPDIFLTALRMAGGIGAVCLFGILPSLMLWKTRYILGKQYKKIFPFGKAFLVIYVFISISIILIEIRNLAA